MIQYALICENGHGFDAWFRSADAFEDQSGRGILACPVCESHAVEKALMAPALRTRAEPAELRAALTALRRKVEAEADDVGERFAVEARRIHSGESDPRDIYGKASREEVAGLLRDGIDVLPLPSLPEDHN